MSVRDKRDPPDVELPLQYLLFRWRREMNVSWEDMRSTPWIAIQRDLEYMDLEGEHLKEQETT